MISAKKLLNNWWFVISACCFYASVYSYDDIRQISLILALLVLCLFSSYYDRLVDIIQKSDKRVIVLSLVATCGMYNYYGFLQKFLIKDKLFVGFCSRAHLSQTLFSSFVVTILSVCSGPFFITLFCWIYNWINENIVRVLRDKWDWKDFIIFLVCVGVLTLIVIILFNMTSAFYTDTVKYDVIYISDTPVYLSGDVWVNLYHKQNDYRQPLFAVASAPFFAPFYFLKRIVPVVDSILPLIITQIHSILMIVSAYLVSIQLFQTRENRWFFVIAFLCIYSSLLFIPMIEQYTVPVFWIFVLIFHVCENNNRAAIVAWLASIGAISTNLILLPFISLKNDNSKFDAHQFWDFLIRCIKHLLLYTGVLFFFTRFNCIYQFFEEKGGSRWVANSGKLLQFLNFPQVCFLFPKGEVVTTYISGEHMTWFQVPQDRLSVASVVIMFLALLGIMICIIFPDSDKERIIGIISLTWIFSSFLIIGVYGWGTKENCLVLYSQYFGWAYFIGVYLLLYKMLILLTKGVRIIISTIFIMVIFIYNVQGLFDMAVKMSEYYPIY